VQYGATNKLNIEVTQTNSAVACLTNQSKGFGQDFVEDFLFDSNTRFVVGIAPRKLGWQFLPLKVLLFKTGGYFVAEFLTEIGATGFDFIIGKTANFFAQFGDSFDHRA
jgi:hypothetical protein